MSAPLAENNPQRIATRSEQSFAPSASGLQANPVLDSLRERLDHWCRIWSPESETTHPEMHRVVSARLAGWLDRCIGSRILGSIHGSEAHVSLANSTPVLTAFLGRRTTREISRRVLRDL